MPADAPPILGDVKWAAGQEPVKIDVFVHEVKIVTEDLVVEDRVAFGRKAKHGVEEVPD